MPAAMPAATSAAAPAAHAPRPCGEFDLIRRYFLPSAPPAPSGGGVELGIGDDAALLAPQPGMLLAVSSDMLVAGRHFFHDTDAAAIGHKALAVNLSDLAAMGAQPLAFTLALALPQADHAWLAAFSQGLLALAGRHGCPLVGGDTTRGPLNVCITIFGQTPRGQALTRAGARAGDDIWISGSLGAARLALHALQGRITLPPATLAAARQRLERPAPRVALGLALRGVARSAIDLSDGLAGDLPHVLQASSQAAGQPLGAELDEPALIGLTAPWAQEAQEEQEAQPACGKSALDAAARLQAALAGGDDYELLFTAAPGARQAVLAAAAAAQTPVTRAGRVTRAEAAAPASIFLRAASGALRPLPAEARGFDHFAA